MARPARHPSVLERLLLYLVEFDHVHHKGTRCQLWTGGKSRGGDRWSEKAWYGTFNPGGEIRGGVRVHVFIAWLHGLIPDLRLPKGYNIDHTCHRSLYCNPLHMEVVTAEENQRRRIRRARQLRALEELDNGLPGWVRVDPEPGSNEPPF